MHRLPILLLAATLGHFGARTSNAAEAEIEFFEKKIRPVLVERCYECHATGAESVKGGLLLDSREASRKGGESGPAVAPGNAEESLLLSALRYESVEMPPDGKLPAAVIADFEKWIKLGAPDPREAPPAKKAAAEIDWAKAKQFWAFQPPKRHTLPALAEPGSMQRAADAFVLAKLTAAGLVPNPPADRRTLIRRVTFDLTGLPPTPQEIADFANDDSPQAYEHVVDRLLASPHYGERWARMWLDVSRYAEDQAHIVGNNTSLCYPNAYVYRNWVIEALNADMPYDEFVRQQLAADLIDPEDEARHVALGFIGLGPKYYRRSDPEVMAEEWEDRVDTVTRGLLGITVACARCHDHKYDPIETQDYYALAGVFASTEMFNRPLDAKREKNKDGQAKKAEDAVHIVRDKKPQDLHVHIRGDVKKQGPLTKRRFLRVVSAAEPQPFTNGSGRLELASAIVSRDNPLTARVIVNRVWGLHFRSAPLVGDAKQLRQPWRIGQRIRRCSTISGRAVHAVRLVAEMAAARDCAFGNLSTGEHDRFRQTSDRPFEPALVAYESAAAGHRAVARRAAGGCRAVGATRGWRIDQTARPWRKAEDHVQLYQPAGPRFYVGHVRFPRSQRAQSQPRGNDNTAAKVVRAEQPVHGSTSRGVGSKPVGLHSR